MEKVIRRRFGLLLALTLPIWSVQGEQAPTDDLPDFNVVPENAARAVLLHAATPECDTVRSCLSIGAVQPRARGDYEILLSSNQYADQTPTIITEEGTPLTWLRSSSSASWSNGTMTRICRHFYRFAPAKKGEYRFRCRDLSFDGVAYDSVLTIQVGAPELNAVPTFLFYGWRKSVVCSSLKYSFGLDAATKPGSIRPTSYGDTAGCRSTPKGSGPITCSQSCSSIFRSSWLSSHSPGWRRFRQMCFSGPRVSASRWLSSSSASNTAGISSSGEKRCCRQSGSTLCFGSWLSSTTGRLTTWTGIFLSHTPIPHGGAPRGVNRSSSRTTAAASGLTAAMTSASAVRSSRLDIPAGTSAG